MGFRIPMLDLGAEWAEVGADVERAVTRVLRSGQYILGPETVAFEQELAERVGSRFCVGVGSGTEALWLSLLALGIGPGDEVITSPFTYFATIEAILWTGATPVFVDIEADSFGLDPARVAGAIGASTRVILPVHLFGRCANVPRLTALADGSNLALVEDAAQAIGAVRSGRHAGAYGIAGCFSFYPSKNLGAAGDAGCVTTDDAAFAEKLRLLRTHGSRQRDRHERVGTTSRLDAVQAAVLRAKLPHLDRWTRRRAEHAARYGERLGGVPGIDLPCVAAGETHAWNQYTVRCHRAEVVRAALDAAGIEARHYYPLPAWKQPAAEGRVRIGSACPETERACREVISLPIHPFLADDTVDEIADVVRRHA